MPINRRNLAPIVRWAGGKRWLVPHIGAIARAWQPTSYVEPFLGGGAVFFAFNWPRPRLNDLNEDLIAAYRGIARNPEAVRKKLSSLRVDRAEFERVRRWRPRRDEWRAARLLYLNRCGYGGIYRTNRDGMFNVPFSGDRSTTSLVKEGRLAASAAALKTASLTSGDFERVLTQVSPGSLVFCDPTYALPGPEESFRRYGAPVFTWLDQERLAGIVHELARRGALVLVSNAAEVRVATLYRGAFVLNFKRRAPLPKAAGVLALESLYVLGRRREIRALSRELERRRDDDSH